VRIVCSVGQGEPSRGFIRDTFSDVGANLPVEAKDPPPTGLGSFRDRVNWLVYKHDLAWTLVMASLALLYVSLGLVEDTPSPLIDQAIQVALNAITGVFVAEFAIRLYSAPSRWHYLKYHWIDLLAVLPSVRFLRLLGLARLAILLRLVRIARLGLIARSLIDANRAATRFTWLSKQNGLPTILLIAVGLLWIGTAAAYEFEHGTNPQFATFGDSFWWAFSTMATLGYGTGPLSVPGRVVAGVLMALGIAMFGLVTATVTTLIIQRTGDVREYTTEDLMAALKDLQGRMSRLENEIIKR
jgi:voltage-gated potassium channel